LIELTEEQEKAIGKIEDWRVRGDKQTLTMGGYAGTGKTTILAHLNEEAMGRIRYVAYTGKATSVMREKLKAADVDGEISTIHSAIYRVVTDENGAIVEWVKRDRYELLGIDTFVVDEASMVPEDIATDLESFDIPVLYVGDHAQLPPIASYFNLMQDPEIKLETIHRNAGGIAEIAQLIRTQRAVSYGEPAPGVKKMSFKSFKGSEAEDICAHASKDHLVIVPTNNQRTQFNRRYLKRKEHPSGNLLEGDRIICLKNNWSIPIYNGMTGSVESEPEPVSNDSFRIDFLPDEFQDGEFPFSVKVTKHLFLNSTGRLPVGVDPRFVANWFDFAYALTCHKAQGSEAEKVVIFGQGFGEERWRWLYTAITRAKKEVYLVG